MTTTKAAKRNPTRGGISLSAFLYAISQEESGDYGAVNQTSGALGKYQVMPYNVALWSKEALGYAITPAQFLASPTAQEKIVRYKLGSYFRAYGPAGAAAAWYSGDPKKAGDTSPQPGGYPSVASYVQNVLNMARRAMHLKPRQLNVGTAGSSGGGTVETVSAAGTAEKLLTDPFGWLAGKAVTPIIVSVEKLATQSLIVLAGVGIIVVGAYQAFQRDNDSGGPDLAAAPALGGKKAGGAAAGGEAGGAAELAALA